MATPLRLAVLGAGTWARTYHIPALKLLEARGLVEIAGIWNRTAEKAGAAAAEAGVPRVYRTLEEILEDRRVGGYCVLVNPAAVAGIIRTLLRRPLPVFTEKTPGAGYREALELAELVRVPNVVAFNRRYMPVNRRFKQLADAASGLYFAECHFYRSERLYPHFIRETGIHGINCMEYLFGPIEQVAPRRWKNPANDTSLWVCDLRFASGLKGLIKFFPCSGSSVERYELHSSSLSAYLFSPQTYTSDYPGKVIVHRGGQVSEVFEADEEDGILVNAGFVDEYLDFIAAAVEGRPAASTISDACNSMRVAEAIEAAPGEDAPRGGR